jgi:hypothetical protein
VLTNGLELDSSGRCTDHDARCTVTGTAVWSCSRTPVLAGLLRRASRESGAAERVDANINYALMDQKRKSRRAVVESLGQLPARVPRQDAAKAAADGKGHRQAARGGWGIVASWILHKPRSGSKNGIDHYSPGRRCVEC